MHKKTLRKKKGGGKKSKVYYSSTEIRAVSTDGGKKWHVDADINGEKRHANLTNHDIMNIISYPASNKDLTTRLVEDFNLLKSVRNERNERNVRKNKKTRKNRK
jgi:hypothetical protein